MRRRSRSYPCSRPYRTRSTRSASATVADDWVTVVRQPNSVFDGSRGDPYAFFVEDDGVGFTDANMAGFDQLYTDRKQLKGGKGRGRFAYLKVFDRVEIELDVSRRGRRVAPAQVRLRSRLQWQ